MLTLTMLTRVVAFSPPASLMLLLRTWYSRGAPHRVPPRRSLVPCPLCPPTVTLLLLLLLLQLLLLLFGLLLFLFREPCLDVLIHLPLHPRMVHVPGRPPRLA